MPVKVFSKRLTLNEINKAIEPLGVVLYKGRGYFYFQGKPVEKAFSTSVMVNNLNELSLEDWISEVKSMIKESKER